MNPLEIVGIVLMVIGDLGPILAGVIIAMSRASQAPVEGSLIPEPVFLASLGALVGGAILFVLAGERAAERAESEREEEPEEGEASGEGTEPETD
jgi:hypothetical protein